MVSNGVVQHFQHKIMLPQDSCPGGTQSLVGLIIGPRGTTQQMLQGESGATVVVRGKGSSRLKTVVGDAEDEEETHVLIRAKSQAEVDKAKELVEKLIDFNSEEGESMRQAQRRKGQVLNGTLREDKEVELQQILTGGAKANLGASLFGRPTSTSGALPLLPQLTFVSALDKPSKPDGALDQEDEYARLMAEIDEESAAPAAAATNDAAALTPPTCSASSGSRFPGGLPSTLPASLPTAITSRLPLGGALPGVPPTRLLTPSAGCFPSGAPPPWTAIRPPAALPPALPFPSMMPVGGVPPSWPRPPAGYPGLPPPLVGGWPPMPHLPMHGMPPIGGPLPHAGAYPPVMPWGAPAAQPTSYPPPQQW